MIAEMTTSIKKSFESSCTILLTLAPNTFLIPISFMRWVMANADSPNKPKQAIKIARQAKW